MSVDIIGQRLLDYQCQTVLEQENALKEVAQEIALMALARADFFRVAAFGGGTCLRILFGLERFSEDLDFVLDKPDNDFNWIPYIKSMQEEFLVYGYSLEIADKTNKQKNVRIAFLKAESKGGFLVIRDLRTNKPKLQIKLEIDVNPPEGSTYQLQYLDFPLPYSIRTQDLPSLFAGKSHALLCRPYTKGRDWYDFLWYVARKTPINLHLLSHALVQTGSWAERDMHVTNDWVVEQLRLKINTIDWHAAKQDVARFLKPRELSTLALWSKEFFTAQVDKLQAYTRSL